MSASASMLQSARHCVCHAAPAHITCSRPALCAPGPWPLCPAAGGVMSIRGRQDRLDFVSTFATAYHFRLLYKGAAMHPIMGALRHEYGGPWEVGGREAGRQAGPEARPGQQEQLHQSREAAVGGCLFDLPSKVATARDACAPTATPRPPAPPSCPPSCPACLCSTFPQVYRRVQLAAGQEEYVLIGSFEGEPTPPQITAAFQEAWRKQAA